MTLLGGAFSLLSKAAAFFTNNMFAPSFHSFSVDPCSIFDTLIAMMVLLNLAVAAIVSPAVSGIEITIVLRLINLIILWTYTYNPLEFPYSQGASSFYEVGHKG